MKLSDLEERIENLELCLYNTLACFDVGQLGLCLYASKLLFADVLDYFNLTYFNPGEPEAENEDRSIVIPLSNPDKVDLLTGEEQEAEMELLTDLFYARLYV